jgi:ankyrin repeat protein
MRDGSDETAFDIALDNGKRDVVNFLAKQDGNPGSRLGEPVCSASLEVEQKKFSTILIVERQRSCTNADEEGSNDEGSTSLHSAVENRSIVVIKRLLDRSADANERDEQLQAPSHSVARNGYLSVVELLVDSGADVEIAEMRNSSGKTPLDLAHVTTTS